MYLLRIRRMVKIVIQQMKKTDDLFEQAGMIPTGGNPRVDHCIAKFKALDPKHYTDSVARQTLALATGMGYLSYIEEGVGGHSLTSRLRVMHKGLLLTYNISYLNELAGTVAKINPVIAIVISLAAIVISIFALRKP